MKQRRSERLYGRKPCDAELDLNLQLGSCPARPWPRALARLPRGTAGASPVGPVRASRLGALRGRRTAPWDRPGVLGDGRGPLLVRGRSAGEWLGPAWPGALRVAGLTTAGVRGQGAMGVLAAAWRVGALPRCGLEPCRLGE